MITLTPSESKRLIARGLSRLPEVVSATTGESGRLIIAGGTTNAFIAEEITGGSIHKSRYTAGIVCGGYACITPSDGRLAPISLVGGQPSADSWQDVLKGFRAGDVFIKGANAIDTKGMAGILTAAPNGGTIGQAVGTVLSNGATLIIAAGLEKLVPDVVAASKVMGISRIERSIGLAVGLFPVAGARIFTEVEALSTLFGIVGTHAASGGVGGSEGSVVIGLEGDSDKVNAAMDYVMGIKGEAPVPLHMGDCNACGLRCDRAAGK